LTERGDKITIRDARKLKKERMRTMEKQKVTLQTVDRALELIDLMASAEKGMSVLEISKALDVTRTGAYNLLNSLMAKNCVEKDPVTNKYNLGYRLFELGHVYAYQYPFAPIVEVVVHNQLSQQWTYPINLCIYKSPGTVVFLGRKRDEFAQRGKMKIVVPAYTRAEGKLLMAYLPEEQLKEDLGEIELKSYAKNTITDKGMLLAQLKEIKARGYAVESEENRGGSAGIACPIFDISKKVVGAVGIELPVDRMREQFEQCLEDLKNACRDISLELGFDPYEK